MNCSITFAEHFDKIPEFLSKRIIYQSQQFHDELCLQNQRLLNEKHYFETQFVYPYIVVTQLQGRFDHLSS